MKTAYNKRFSKFIVPCEQNLIAQQDALDSGLPVYISLPKELRAKKGYPGDITVTLDSTDSTNFEADPAPDFEADPAPARFPARIKAAASALRNCGKSGRFTISHGSGDLSIVKTLAEPSAA